MEDFTDADYLFAKRVFDDFRIKHLGKYDDLYDQSNTFLLVDIFGTFGIGFLKYMNSNLLVFVLHQD